VLKTVIEKIPRFRTALYSIYAKGAKIAIESYYRQVAEEISSRLNSGMILDVGTGPGYLPIEIVRRSPATEVVGIELVSKLVRMAQENSARSGVADRLHFQIADGAKLPFKDNSYDIVTSTGVLHTLKEPVKVMNECYRVLKPNGEMWIYDPAKVFSGIDMKRCKASFTLWEIFVYKLSNLFRLINPPYTYSPEQVIKMIAISNFRDYCVEERDDELKIKLKKAAQQLVSA
jgi:ubiquinone/menaquinone biosynthesis C-methylase UbiE